MAQFSVDPDALAHYAKRFEGYGSELDELLTTLSEARVGRDAFGHIPTVGSRIYSAYDDHVDKCTLATSSAASVAHSVAANLAGTAVQYLHAEESSTVK